MNLEEYSKHGQFYTDGVPPLLVAVLSDNDWNSCLDLGCGDGALLSALKNQGYFNGKSVFAVDTSPSRIDLVKRICEDFNCIIADGCNISIEDGAIDLLISTQVIEHVSNDHDMVKEMHRLLRQDGLLYLSTVFKKKYGWYFYRCNGKWTLDPTHLREYTADDQLLDILRACGFEIVVNNKTLDGRPITDSILRRLGMPRHAYDNRFLKKLRTLRVPIPGYYLWELVCQRV